MNNVNDHKYRVFLDLAVKHQSRIFGFIMRLLPNFAAAEDIMQETMMVMWQKFHEFREGTDFLAWAKQVARYKVMDYIQKQKTKNRSMVCLSEEVMGRLLVQDVPHVSQNIYDEALHNCVDKLKGTSREMIHLRYIESMKINEIAAKYKMHANAIAKQMSRVHHALQQCIRQTLKAWEMSNG